MSKKKKDTPEIAAPMPEQPSVNGWPVCTESRFLPVRLTVDQLRDKSDEMARATQEKVRLEDQKKSASSQYKAAIDSKTATINELAQIITDRAQHKDVKCEWRYEQSGFDAEGNAVYHPEKKTLVRLDDNTAVEIRSITDEDRQMQLKLEEAAVKEEVGAEAESSGGEEDLLADGGDDAPDGDAAPDLKLD